MIDLFPMSRDDANALVRSWHRHHKPVQGHKFAVGARLDDRNCTVVGCVIVARPVAEALDDGTVFEVTRLCGPGVDAVPASKNVASKLLAAARDASFAMGVRAVISYLRFDEAGVCYKAAGWVPVAEVPARGHDDRAQRQRRRQAHLPGFYEPSTEAVARVRWETRPSSHLKAVGKMIAAMGRFADARRREVVMFDPTALQSRLVF